MDKTSIANLITQLFIWNFAKISIFQAVTTGYIKVYQSKKITKSNKQYTHYWSLIDDRWLTKTLTQISAHKYSWQTWLISTQCSQKTSHVLSVSNGLTSVLSDVLITMRKSHETIVVGYFLKIPNTCERCFWEFSEMSRNRNLFWDMLKTS